MLATKRVTVAFARDGVKMPAKNSRTQNSDRVVVTWGELFNSSVEKLLEKSRESGVTARGWSGLVLFALRWCIGRRAAWHANCDNLSMRLLAGHSNSDSSAKTGLKSLCDNYKSSTSAA